MKTQTRPWYSEPWPWLLMSGPALVVIAGIYTTVLAVSSSDGLVADDYYKEGLAINRSLERDALAAARGISATVEFGEAAVRVSLKGQAGAGGALHLRLLHPTRSGLDQDIPLRPVAPGLWEGRLQPMPEAHWQVQLAAPDAGWRLAGEWHDRQPALTLRPSGAEPRP